METLTFVPSAEQEKMLEAQFTSKDTNVVQYHITQDPAPGSRTEKPNIFIHASISPDMPWILIKSIVNAPHELIFAIDVPADVIIRISTNAQAIDAALLTA